MTHAESTWVPGSVPTWFTCPKLLAKWCRHRKLVLICTNLSIGPYKLLKLLLTLWNVLGVMDGLDGTRYDDRFANRRDVAGGS